MSSNALVSVIIPAYNAEKFIGRALDSVIKQTWPAVEIIIIDDGSSDNTAAVCREYMNSHDHIRYIRKQNGGVSSARNEGIKAASGCYICFLDSDDTYEPDFIRTLVNKVTQDDRDFAYCLFRKIHSGGHITQSVCYDNTDTVITDFLNFDYFDICCLMLKKEFLDKNNLFFDSSMVVGEDVLFILECLNKGAFSYIKEYLYNYIYHSESLMNKKWKKADYISDLDAWKKILSYIAETYNKPDQLSVFSKVRAKVLSLQIQFMWNMLATGLYPDLKSYIKDFSYHKSDFSLIRKPGKNKFRLNIVLSGNIFVWRIARKLLTKKKNIIPAG
ncbi:glycosyltransferase [Morganella morganii]|uniref:glycosyltransferase family 2 protein n=1 Tax=Morganella morganii TaxID=582 RepID=UPI001F2ED480|nr:glycosyltransferase family 2 protein [Morganella morganii]MCF1264527.1 glycosyltransferase [Morganella morganii]